MSLFSRTASKKQIKNELDVYLNAIAKSALIIDQQGNVLAYNSKARESFAELGLKLTTRFQLSHLEKFIDSIDDKDYSDFMRKRYRRIFSKPKFNVACKLKLKDEDQKFTFKLSMGALVKDPQTHYILIIFRDITDELKTQALQKTFIRIVGHELKQPLGLIKAHTYYLKRFFNNTKNNQEIDYVKRIEEQVNIIAHTFNDIVDATRFSLRSFSIYPELTNIMNLLNKSVEEMHLLNPNREINMPQVNPVVVNCFVDPLRTQQVFNNILSNAIKYSNEKSTIEIKVKLKSNSFVISFIDQGAGISSEEIENIFEPYFRSKDAHKKKVKGLGLGLSFVKNILTRQGGKVSVKSELKKGSTFTLSFPLAT